MFSLKVYYYLFYQQCLGNANKTVLVLPSLAVDGRIEHEHEHGQRDVTLHVQYGRQQSDAVPPLTAKKTEGTLHAGAGEFNNYLNINNYEFLKT